MIGPTFTGLFRTWFGRQPCLQGIGQGFNLVRQRTDRPCRLQQCKGRAIVTAAVIYVLRVLVDEDIPLNHGVLRAIENTCVEVEDVSKLIGVPHGLVDKINTVRVIEHTLDVIKTADWVIDLGPEGGHKGGYLTFSGTPEDLAKEKDNYTAKYLKEAFV